MGECFLYGNGSGDGCKIKFENYMPMGQQPTHTIFPNFSTKRGGEATTVGSKALFAGGKSSDTVPVDVYTELGIHTTFPALSAPRDNLAATTVGSKALFGGGYGKGFSSDLNPYQPRKHETVDVYTESGSRTTFPDMSKSRDYVSATTVGTKALFGGGSGGGATDVSLIVDAYTETGVHTIFPNLLGSERVMMAATTVGTKALFGGGVNDGDMVVDAYTETGTHTTFPNLTAGRSNHAATTVGAKALFGGGGSTAAVDTYTEAGVLTVFPDLSEARQHLAATTVGTKALFGGGENSNSGSYYKAAVDAYTEAGVLTAFPNLSEARMDLAATTVGAKALFGGGGKSGSSSQRDQVDAYIDLEAEDPQAHLRVMPGGVYNFGGGERTVPGSMISDPSVVIDVQRPVNGYIKYKGAKFNG